MQTLTLIPNASNEGVMVLIMLILGSFNIARHVHLRWLKRHLSFVASNALIKWLIVLAGLLILPLHSLFNGDVRNELISLPIGLLFGVITIYLETKLIRKLNRLLLIKKSRRTQQNDHHMLRNAIINKTLSLSSKTVSAKGLVNIRQGHHQFLQSPDFLNYSLLAVILVAIAEEWLFRGYLHALSMQFHSQLTAIVFMTLGLAIFVLSHLSTQWSDCTNKLPLAILAMLSIFLTGTLTSAIVLHVLINAHAWWQMKKWNATNPILEPSTC